MERIEWKRLTVGESVFFRFIAEYWKKKREWIQGVVGCRIMENDKDVGV